MITVHSGPIQHCVALSPAAAVPTAQLLQQRAARKQQQRVALVAPPPHPGHNLGLGRDSSCPPRLYSARSNGRRQSESDGQASISEDQKPPPAAASLNPSRILSLPFSLIRAECSQQPRMASSGGNGDGGAAAAPLAGARVRLEPRAAPSRRATVVPFADRARAVA